MGARDPVSSNAVQALDFDMSGKPAAGARMETLRTRKVCRLLPAAQGSSAYLETVPTAQAVFSIRRNGVEVATLTFAANAKAGTFATTSNGPTNLVVGDRVSIHAPASQDSTAADLSGNLVLLGA